MPPQFFPFHRPFLHLHGRHFAGSVRDAASFAVVPEPQTAAMVMLGATVLLRRSSRRSQA